MGFFRFLFAGVYALKIVDTIGKDDFGGILLVLRRIFTLSFLLGF
jgi:hypothetical protein